MKVYRVCRRLVLTYIHDKVIHNAKKHIEEDNMCDSDGKTLGKGSHCHAASVVVSTVDDHPKDTAGHSLHVLVILFSTITLVIQR